MRTAAWMGLLACLMSTASPAHAQPARKDPPPVPAKPGKVVYIVDASAASEKLWQTLSHELWRAIEALAPQQQFAVILACNGKAITLPTERQLTLALPGNTRKVHWALLETQPAGKPTLDAALEAALRLKPDVIHLACSEPKAAEALIAIATKWNPEPRIRINVIFVGVPNLAAETALKRLATDSGGVFKHDTLAPLPGIEPPLDTGRLNIGVVTNPDKTWKALMTGAKGDFKDAPSLLAGVRQAIQSYEKAGGTLSRVEIFLNLLGPAADDLRGAFREPLASMRAMGVLDARFGSINTTPMEPVKKPDPADDTIVIGQAPDGALRPFGIPGGGSGIGPRIMLAGVQAHGMRVAFVVDASASSVKNWKWMREEMETALDGLHNVQGFQMVISNDGIPLVMAPADEMPHAIVDQTNAARRMLAGIKPAGDPALAQSLAMALKSRRAQAIYILISSTKEAGTLLEIARATAQATRPKLHIIYKGPESPADEKNLRALAELTAGEFKRLPPGE